MDGRSVMILSGREHLTSFIACLCLLSPLVLFRNIFITALKKILIYMVTSVQFAVSPR